MDGGRRVWRVRLAAWGTVLVMAVVAFNVRTGAPDPDEGANGPPRNGTTDQGEAVWAVADERVREFGITWEFGCDDGTELREFSATYRQGQLRYDGRSFRATDESRLRGGRDGWVPHVRSELSGRPGPSGELSGHASAVLWFQRGTERGPLCRSGRVGWSIPPA